MSRASACGAAARVELLLRHGAPRARPGRRGRLLDRHHRLRGRDRGGQPALRHELRAVPQQSRNRRGGVRLDRGGRAFAGKSGSRLETQVPRPSKERAERKAALQAELARPELRPLVERAQSLYADCRRPAVAHSVHDEKRRRSRRSRGRARAGRRTGDRRAASPTASRGVPRGRSRPASPGWSAGSSPARWRPACCPSPTSAPTSSRRAWSRRARSSPTSGCRAPSCGSSRSRSRETSPGGRAARSARSAG